MRDNKIIEPGKWYAEFDEAGNTIKVVYHDSFRRLLGYESAEEFSNSQEAWEESISPEDVERLNIYYEDVVSKHPEGMDYDIEYRMKTKKGFRWFHDYAYVTRREDGSLKRLDGVVFDIQDTVDASLLREEQIAKMAGGVSSYIVNPYTEQFKILYQNNDLAKKYPEGESFDKSFKRYVENEVYGPDKLIVSESINVSKMVEQLEHNDEYTFRYRDISAGYPRWYEMRSVRLSDDEILYGFYDIDEEIIEQLIFDKMRDSYMGLIYINIDTGFAQIVKTSYPEVTGEYCSVIRYSDFMKRILSDISGEEAKFIKRISDLEFIKECFEKEDTLYHIYKSQMFGAEKWINATGQVLVRHNDGTPSVFSLGFSLLDEDASRKEEAKYKLAESMEVVGGLASEYTALYHVNLDTDDYVPYYLSRKVEDIKPYYESNHKFVDLAKTFANSTLVREEDCDILCDFYPSAEAVKEKLKDKKRVSVLFKRNYGGEYLWTEAVLVKCEKEDEEPHNIIVGFAEKEEEVIERKLHFEEIAKANNLIENISSKYNLAYTANLADDSFSILKIDKSIVLGEEIIFDKLSDALNFFLESIIHPADREFMRHEFDYATIMKKCNENKVYSVEYRSLVNGASSWNEMSVTHISGDNVAIGFALNDLEITKKHLEEKKFNEYLALFVVDLDTGMIKSLKTPPLFKTAPEGEAFPYAKAMQLYAQNCEGEAKDFFIHISDINHVKEHFMSNDKVTYAYKSSQFGMDRWIDVTGYVILRHQDGTPAFTTLGFSLSDALATARQEVQSQIKEDMHMIGGLASGYDTLYYVNIDENFCRIFLYGGMRKEEGEQSVSEYDDVFEVFRESGNSECIHPDDRPFFATFSAETVRGWLKNKKKFQTRFRRSFNGEYKWCEMDVIKYENAEEEANAIAVGFASRDAEIRSEQAMNDCFKILGKEISPQESIDLLLKMVGEYYNAERSYIFEFVQNNEFICNTYEWCAKDIEPMISKLQEIPYEAVEGWVREFEAKGAFYMDALDGANTTEEDREILAMQGIDSLISAPIMSEDRIVGFIGVDNPKKAIGNIEILKTVAIVSYSEILKRKENDEEHITLGKLTDAFMSVYYVDLSTDYMRTWKIAEEYKDAYGKTEKYSVSMGGYVRENIAVRDRKRCIEMTSPEYVLEHFKTKDRFSIEMTDIMLGYERNFVYDYIKVNEEGTQLVLCSRDITETLEKEREQQRQLEEARNAAEEASKSKTSFLFNMSHDIRTPMNAITGFTNMAKRYVDDKEKVIDYLDKIDTSGLQLLSLVNQVLEMARIESGRVELEENPISVHEEYDSMIVVLSEQAEANGLEFNHSLVNITHNRVLADQARMSSITLNITGNAMKYTPKGGRIDFTVKEIPGRKEGFATFVFTVSDNGIGMSEEYLKVLYEPFTREKSSTVSKIQGTGLGMSIVKELVELMGGTINVESHIGKGTKFDITIDFKIDDEDRSEFGIGSNAPKVSFEGRKILLVEDNELNREIANDILSYEKFEIEEAEDGIYAVEKLKEKGPDYYDFILMDIQMPIMNGYDATKAIREMYPESRIPIIALSANAFSEDKERSLAAGMDAHVSKPIKVKELLSTLARYL